ncbi:release factor glutamine methyltransferase [Rubritalea squalenifaciens DSM 18772]|uniref:Release factor glutamine methyltransferase n=1 Tax=Rubritalea squalenifaciens DSM 18772 TaxID=1123071 RepID=A0A1M6GLY2_9BACT|nr:peptide chain release factor N(5)-glutamine methyltransferase [Rubritalea squalenifaciens]SHJ10960.1 release factor glutamine methyltransferase [Rubritalea squalenifaciens DSM 18772]
MKTILDTLEAGTTWLEKKGIEDARRNMQLMICHQLDCSKIQLYTRFDEPLDESALAPLRVMLKQRGEGVPLQHLLGTVEFYLRDFHTDARALIPRPETEELAEILIKRFKLPESPAILDMGTGSGVLGITLAKEIPSAAVTCADVSTDALSLAEQNATALDAQNIRFVHSDLFSQIEGGYDLIVANLPYVPETDRPSLAPELAHDPDLALFGGQDGLDIIRTFIQEAPSYLNPGGIIALEIGIHQNEEVEKLLSATGFTDIKTYPDLSGILRFPTASKS